MQKIQIIKKIRSFFDEQGFTEIIAPVLNLAIPLEAHIHPFETQWKTSSGERTMYLSTSPEQALKRALADGLGNCYSIGHSFRNLEQEGPRHTPEFLMLEWYREDATYTKIMDDCKDLFGSLGLLSDFSTFSLVDLFHQYCHFDIQKDDLVSHMKKHDYFTDRSTWHELFDQLFLNEIEPHLPKSPLFLTDFPARISPLCAPQADRPYLAQRFEIYINGVEIGNGNTENTNSSSVRQVFEKLHKKKNQPVDEEFLSALDRLHVTGKSYAGIGIGIDRLTSIFSTPILC